MEQQSICERVDAIVYEKALGSLEARVDDPVSFLQSAVYANIHEQRGKTVLRIIAHRSEKIVACAVAVKYDAPLGLSFLYLPYGPVVSSWDNGLLLAFKVFLRHEAKRLNCSFVRIDNFPNDLQKRSLSNRLARAASLQPRAEWIIDITPAEDTLWTAMHKHARYNIRLAERASAEIRVFSPADAPIDDFYALMKTTASRDDFSIFDKAYYKSYLSCLTADSGFVIMCYIDGKPAATGLFVVHDKQAHYVFAGSSDDFRKIAPAYSVIWEAMKRAKQRGCTYFNFGGISDNVKGQAWAGVTSFKKRFGGFAAAHPNPIDIVVRPLWYGLFRLYKSIR